MTTELIKSSDFVEPVKSPDFIEAVGPTTEEETNGNA
jgi:hypothetical protein